MLTKNSRRVVIIDKIKSDMIEQAIFILKGNEGDAIAAECGIVAEAQGIIENYIRRMNRVRASYRAERRRSERKRAWLPYFTAAAVSLSVIAAVIYALV